MEDHECHYYDEEITYSETGLPFRIRKVCRGMSTVQDTVLCDVDICEKYVTTEDWRDRISRAIEESRRLVL